MVLEHGLVDRAVEIDAMDNLEPGSRVQLDEIVFLGCQRLLFHQNLRGYGDLANVMNISGNSYRCDFAIVHTQCIRDLHSKFRDSALMSGGKGIALLDGGGERLDSLFQRQGSLGGDLSGHVMIPGVPECDNSPPARTALATQDRGS